MSESSIELSSGLSTKYRQLQADLRRLERVIVAFSGGVDSSLVAFVANQVLGRDALAVTSASKSLKRSDLSLTHDLAQSWGLNHRVILTDELDKEQYRANPVNRCFYCKTSLYSQLAEIAKEAGFKVIVNGTNTDDLGDHRPGLIAASDFHVHSPLVDAGFCKADIRQLSNYLGLENADKPQAACLSSRVPYGSHITEELLDQIERAEDVLSSMGFREFRVRHHDDVARIEVGRGELGRAVELSSDVEERIKACGYRFVALDLGGFRSGSLNEGLIQAVNIAE